MANKLYNNLAIASILMMLPFVVTAGMFIGYLAADSLYRSFAIPGWMFVIIVVFGLVSGAFEGYRMLKLAIRLEKEDKK